MKQPAFEWYYIDAHCQGGYDIVFTLHTLPFMSVFDIVIWDLFVYKENRPYLHRFSTHPQNRLQRQNNPLLLQSDGQNYLRHEKNGIRLFFKEKDIELWLRLKQSKPIYYSTEKNLLPHSETNTYFNWTVFTPLSEAEGQLHEGSHTVSLQGIGYHDYNAGNIFLKKELKRWQWNKLYFGNRLLIIGNIEDREGNTKLISAISADGSLRWATHIKIEKKQSEIRYDIDDETFVFKEIKSYGIDDIRFFTCAPERKDRWSAKMRELIAYYSIINPLLKPIRAITTNVRYKRFRSEGILNGRTNCQIFYEEMYF